MWHSLFDIDIPVAEKIIRPFLIYAFLIVALRLAGKRELGQLNMLDFVVLLAVANAVQNGIIGNEVSVTGAVIGATVLLLTNAVIAELTVRYPKLRRIVIGSPAELVRNGVVNRGKLRRERISEEEVLNAIIDSGGTRITDAQLVILAPNGHLLVELKRDVTLEKRMQGLESKLDQVIAELRGGSAEESS